MALALVAGVEFRAAVPAEAAAVAVAEVAEDLVSPVEIFGIQAAEVAAPQTDQQDQEVPEPQPDRALPHSQL